MAPGTAATAALAPSAHRKIFYSECANQVGSDWIDDPTSPPDTQCVGDMPKIEFNPR
jgi:hypothetical protein